ncbi:unnamed protein product [Alopecurus aequalis]
MTTRRRHRQTMSLAAEDGSTESRWAERKRLKRCQKLQDQKEYTGPSLTEDIWCHIHSLLPLRDAARAACVSHAFRWSWRHLPNLTFSKDSLRLTRNASRKEGISREFTKKVDHILKNHSHIGVRTLEFRLAPHYHVKDHRRLDRWHQMGITPGIEKVVLCLSPKDGRYRFPCSVFSDGKGDSIHHFGLANCSFCPTARPWCLRNLAVLDLSFVDVTGDGLWGLLSSSTALERLSLKYCSGIIFLKIPGSLKQLGYLKVAFCDDLQAVESKAPNLSRFNFEGNLPWTQISLGETLRVKDLHMDCSNFAVYTRAMMASNDMPYDETVDPAKVYICSRPNALVSFFGASHSVEDFVSYVSGQLADHVSFCSALRGSEMSTWSVQEEKRMVEGACCMLKAWLS